MLLCLIQDELEKKCHIFVSKTANLFVIYCVLVDRMF